MAGPSLEETRREFLLRLARGATLAAPVVITLRPDEAAAQGKGPPTAGGLSPSSTAVQDQPSGTEQLAPWEPAGSAKPAPWERPPPTSSGG